MGKAKTRRSALPFPKRPAGVSEVRPISDGERLLWERFIGPAQAALGQVQNSFGIAQTMVVECMMERAGINPADGWKLNVDKMQYEKHPVPVEPSNK